MAVGRVTRDVCLGQTRQGAPPSAREGSPVHPKLGFMSPLVWDPCSGRLWMAPGLFPAAGSREGAAGRESVNLPLGPCFPSFGAHTQTGIAGPRCRPFHL